MQGVVKYIQDKYFSKYNFRFKNIIKSDIIVYVSHHNFLLKHSENYNNCISILLGCIRNRSLYFSALKSTGVLLKGSFCSTNPPTIMISYSVTWCSHQPMNGDWQELKPPFPFPNVYIGNKSPHQLPTKLLYRWHTLLTLPTVEKIA